jgi:LysR family transcriptional regulator, regulator for bpeEF and oprC
MLFIIPGDKLAAMDLRVLTIFIKVSERRSFVRAAAELGMGQSGVSNAIHRLENELGVELLARTTRRVNLTENGAAFLQRCRQIVADLDEARQVLSHARLQPTGRLRIDLPGSFGRVKIVPPLGAFRAAYPALKLAVTLTDRYIDLVEEGVDVTIRIGTLQDSSLIARQLTQYQFRTVGAPSYFAAHGRPRKLDDLTNHNCLSFTTRDTGAVRAWRFRRDGAEFTLAPQGDMSFNDGAALLIAARGGYGLAQIQDYYADPAIAVGELESVLTKFDPSPNPVSLVYPHTRHLTPKVRAFVDFMTDQFHRSAAAHK